MSKTQKELLQRVTRLVEAAETCRGYRDVGIHTKGYVESGYTDPESGIVATGNWNPGDWNAPKEEREMQTMPRLAEALGKLGVNLEWEDEWTVCSTCDGLVRIGADSYDWKQNYYNSDDGPKCADCVRKNPTEYLAGLEGNSDNACTFDLDLAGLGYRQVKEEFCHGLYGGQDSDPKAIGVALRTIGVSRYLFFVNSVGQFDMNFSLWIHRSEWRRFRRGARQWEAANKRCALDPAEACRMALVDAHSKMGQLPEGPGVRMAKCQADGTATVCLVSPEDFLAGKVLN